MAWKPIFIMIIFYDVATVQHKLVNKIGLSEHGKSTELCLVGKTGSPAHGKPAGRIGK